MATVELTSENFEAMTGREGLALVNFLGVVVRAVPRFRAGVRAGVRAARGRGVRQG